MLATTLTLEGKVAALDHAGPMGFYMNAAGASVYCLMMVADKRLPPQDARVRVTGAWSRGIKGYFEVARMETV